VNSSFFPSKSTETPPSIIPETDSAVSRRFVMGDTKHFCEGERPTLSPLTDEQIVEHCGTIDLGDHDWVTQVVRAVERAHGIVGDGATNA